MTRLALLRHGHTSWNRAGRIQGRSDIALDDAARADLQTRALPPPWARAQLWSSPLKRAVETATCLTGRNPAQSPALLEMDWGAWEGQHGATLKADLDSGFRDIEAWGWSYRPPGGQSPTELAEQLSPWLYSLHSDKDHVAICHIGVMRVLLAQATGWAFDGPCPFSIKRNRLYVLHRDEGAWQYDGVPIRLLEGQADPCTP